MACAVCAKTAVHNPTQAQSLWEQVQKEVAQMGLQVPGAACPPLEVHDRHGMKTVLHGVLCCHQPKEALGLTLKREVRTTGHAPVRSVDKVCVLKAVPGQHMAATMAHELCHVYLWLAGFPNLPPPLEEGLCELVKAEWLEYTCPRVGGKQDSVAAFLLHAMEKNTDPVYGGGYRAAKAALKKHGSLHDLLLHVKKNRRL